MISYLPVSIIMLSLFPTAVITLFIFIKYKKEGIKEILFLKMMFLGALSVIPAIFIISITTGYLTDSIVNRYLIKPFISIALIEELIKLSILRVFLFRNNNFNTVKEGIIYSIAISIGFAFFENILYLTGDPDQLSTFVSRTLSAVPLHALCGAFMGLFAGLNKRDEKKYWFRALIISVFLHGLYNSIVILPPPFNMFSLILIITAVFLLRGLYRKNL